MAANKPGTSAFADDPILFVQQGDPGFVRNGFLGCHLSVGHNRETISGLAEVGGGSGGEFFYLDQDRMRN